MPEEIRMDYEAMDAMSLCFQVEGGRLQDVNTAMQTIATSLEEGALLGDAGEAFVEAIRDKLCPAINKLVEKFKELDKDIRGAVEDMKKADTTSKSLF